jgi:alpha-glucosidase (family GH31 glycosyl hydrolase)
MLPKPQSNRIRRTQERDSEVGDRVSFFVIAGNDPDEIYSGYRLLTGATPMLPKSAYGYIQCKQRDSSQAEVLAKARGDIRVRKRRKQHQPSALG